MARGSAAGSTNGAFAEACDTVRRLLGDVVRDEVLTRHKIGVVLGRVQREAGTYGDSAVERMADTLGTSSHVLYQCARVAENWSTEGLAALSARVNSRGEPITWSHLVVLTKARTEPARGAWVERCLAQSWSVRDLKEAIAAERARTEDDEREAPEGEPVRIALREGLQHAARAAVQFEVILEALQARLAEDDGPGDADLRARVILAYEKVGGRVDETLGCLRATTPRSEQRIRVEMRSSESLVGEDEEAEVPRRRARVR
jgi:hypothetical protein